MSPLNTCQERIVCTYCVSQVTALTGKAQIKPSLPILFTSLFQPTNKNCGANNEKIQIQTGGEKKKSHPPPLFIRL